MAPGGRIRVLIAGNVYVKRALVRRFLEDDGYEVVGDVMTADEVVPGIEAGTPDAVVLDEDLTEQGTTIGRIRAAAPDARIVVFTRAAPGQGAPPPGADGYLDKGVGLSALTALLGRLFSEPTVPLEPMIVSASVTAGVATANVAPEVGMGEADTNPTEPITAVDEPPAESAPEENGKATGGGGSNNVLRLVAMVAGGLLIVWGVLAAMSADEVGGGGSAPVAEASPTAGGSIIVDETTPLDEAYAALDRMMAAIEGGNYVLAAVEAQSLMDQRQQAFDAGFATSGLDAEVTARLEAVVGGLPARVNMQLAAILGDLYPTLEEPSEPGGGSTQVLGQTVTSTGGTSGGSTTGGSTTGGGSSTGGGGGGGQTQPGPGDGKEWGQSHHVDGGRHGGPPPWAGPK